MRYFGQINLLYVFSFTSVLAVRAEVIARVVETSSLKGVLLTTLPSKLWRVVKDAAVSAACPLVRRRVITLYENSHICTHRDAICSVLAVDSVHQVSPTAVSA